MAETKIYRVKDGVLAHPIHTNLDGIPVAVGGEVTIRRTPPQKKLTIPEATPEQLTQLVTRRIINPKYVEEVKPKKNPVKKKATKTIKGNESKATKSDTTSDKRPKEENPIL